jgi:hypothetical protein
MSYLIAVSDSPDDGWMLSNSLFRWFANVFNARFAGDDELKNQMEIVLAIHGVSLHHLTKENPPLEAKIPSSAAQSCRRDRGRTSRDLL